jgi:uncharacterized protein YbjQ (UPF0145 family)
LNAATAMNENKCENCNCEIGSEILVNGPLKSIEQLSQSEIKKIDQFYFLGNKSYCSRCRNERLSKARKKIDKRIQECKSYILDNIDVLPIVTTHNPYDWSYDNLGIVTGQSTIETEDLTKITSSFTDLFGLQSKTDYEKSKKGENQCFLQLRLQTLNLGGNAIIATDIDYSEIDSLKGKIMVCASGTPVKINNLEKLNFDNSSFVSLVVRTKEILDELLLLKETI